MELTKSKVVFNQEDHTYHLGNIELQGITGMLSRQLFPDKYKDVPKFVLDRAAERGSLIHEACELVDELGVSHESEEAQNYIKLKSDNHLVHEASEYLVSDEFYFASSIDKVYRDSEDTFSLADIKTTSKLDEEYVSWQLSIYAYLFIAQNPGAKVNKLYAIWLRGETAELVEVERKSDDLVLDLLKSEVDGEQFNYKPVVKDTLPQKYVEMEHDMMVICEQEKVWKDRKKELTDGLMKEMVKAGAYSWNGEHISITRKKDSIRKSFDKEAFEKDYPGVYEKYMKESPVVGSITIKAR